MCLLSNYPTLPSHSSSKYKLKLSVTDVIRNLQQRTVARFLCGGDKNDRLKAFSHPESRGLG